MMYGSWNMRCGRQKYLSFWAVFCFFSPPDNAENQNFKIEKSTWRYCLTHLHHKWQSYDAWFLRYGAWQIDFWLFWTVFCPFTSQWTQKINILKKWKQTWRYYYFKNVYQKWQSYDAWFLRYGVQQTIFSVILDCFWLFYPPNSPKN